MTNIKATIIAHSISEAGKEIVTFELEFPKYLVGEFNTHRVFSRNSASSRAIPISATIKGVQDNPSIPVYWGKNQPGMSAKEELNDVEEIARMNRHGYVGRLSDRQYARQLWLEARDVVIEYAKKLDSLGLHKQTVNRILEPWIMTKVVVTSTEWPNWYGLRDHGDAQPEIACLAGKMNKIHEKSVPMVLKENEWHLPYVTNEDRAKYPVETLLKLSASLCAQVSYRLSNESIDKAIDIYDKLVDSKPVHASPFEHQARPLYYADEQSGNFFGWHQYRQDIPNNVITD